MLSNNTVAMVVAFLTNKIASALTKPLLRSDLSVYVAINFSVRRLMPERKVSKRDPGGLQPLNTGLINACSHVCCIVLFVFCRLLFITSLASTRLLCFIDFISIAFGNGHFYYCLSWMIDLGVNDPHFLRNEYWKRVLNCCWFVFWQSTKTHCVIMRISHLHRNGSPLHMELSCVRECDSGKCETKTSHLRWEQSHLGVFTVKQKCR